jgi:hypothetical protein
MRPPAIVLLAIALVTKHLRSFPNHCAGAKFDLQSFLGQLSLFCVIFEHESYGEDFPWKNDVRFSAATETGLAKNTKV